jgi:hypothetical protein
MENRSSILELSETELRNLNGGFFPIRPMKLISPQFWIDVYDAYCGFVDGFSVGYTESTQD